MSINFNSVIIILVAVAVYYFKSDSDMIKMPNPSLVFQYGQYFTEDGGIKYENPYHKPRKFYPEDFEKYFNVRLVNHLIDDDSIKALLDAHDIHMEEEYLNDQAYYDGLADQYGLYIEKVVADDRRFYVAYAGHDKHYGVFADVDIPKGSYIGEYTGILTNNTANNDYAWEYMSEKVKDENGKNLDLEIDGRIFGNILRFVNHNDHPSLDAMEVPWRNRWHRIYVAARDIYEGEELFVSYGSAYWATRKGKV